MHRVSALPLKAVGFGPNSAAARLCLNAVGAALRCVPNYPGLFELVQDELAANDVHGPSLRFLQSLVDETAEVAIGLRIDVDAVMSRIRTKCQRFCFSNLETT
jgi:hypothetical protein